MWIRNHIARPVVCLALCLGWIIAPTAMMAETRQADPTTLATVVEQARPGDIIALAGGHYGALSIRGAVGQASNPVTIMAQNPNIPPVFDRLTLRDTVGITLDGLYFDYSYDTEDVQHLRPFQILGSNAITLQNNIFDGDRASGTGSDKDGYGTAFGIGIRDSTNITIHNNEIHTFLRGAVIHQSQNIIVSSNDIHSLRSDGINLAEVRNVEITGNTIHDFERASTSGDHPDMIQMWTNGTNSPSVNVAIRDNILNSGQGPYTQSIFMRNDMVDRGIAGEEMFYRDIVIEGNVILNAHLHGITIGETDGLIIRNNTVVRNAISEGEQDNQSLWVPQIRITNDAVNVTVTDNVTSKIVGFEEQTDWTLTGNVFVQDNSRLEANFYGIVFGTDALATPYLVSAFGAEEGGILDGQRIGAPILWQYE